MFVNSPEVSKPGLRVLSFDNSTTPLSTRNRVIAVTKNRDATHGSPFSKVSSLPVTWRFAVKLLEEKVTTAISLKNILFATDFSEVSEAALPYAAAMSLRYGGMVHIAHVLPEINLVRPSAIDPATI